MQGVVVRVNSSVGILRLGTTAHLAEDEKSSQIEIKDSWVNKKTLQISFEYQWRENKSKVTKSRTPNWGKKQSYFPKI